MAGWLPCSAALPMLSARPWASFWNMSGGSAISVRPWPPSIWCCWNAVSQSGESWISGRLPSARCRPRVICRAIRWRTWSARSSGVRPASRRSAMASRMTGRLRTETRSASSRRSTCSSSSIEILEGTRSSRKRRLATAFSGEETLTKASSSACRPLRPSSCGKCDLMISSRCVASTSPGVTSVSPIRFSASDLGIQRAGAP